MYMYNVACSTVTTTFVYVHVHVHVCVYFMHVDHMAVCADGACIHSQRAEEAVVSDTVSSVRSLLRDSVWTVDHQRSQGHTEVHAAKPDQAGHQPEGQLWQ